MKTKALSKTVKRALLDALARCTFLERRRDHWRALYKDLEASITENASRPGFVAEDERALVDKITSLEAELVAQKTSADEFRRRACDAERERESFRVALEEARDDANRSRASCMHLFAEREQAEKERDQAFAERDAARSALAELRAASAGVATDASVNKSSVSLKAAS